MRIKNVFKRKPSKYNQLVDDIQYSFDNVALDTNQLRMSHNNLRDELDSLKEELATNGVVSRLRSLEKENKTLRDALNGLHGYVDEVEANLDELKQHTASLIMQHDEQINKTQVKEKESVASIIWAEINGGSLPTPMQPTLAGKVEAILEHLNLDVSVKPEEVKKAKVEAKKKKPAKKGKK